jgi:hypothetical protein
MNIVLVVWLIFPSFGYALEGDDILGERVTENRDCRVARRVFV